jgi:hypothetical protein
MPDDNMKADDDAPQIPATEKDGSEPRHRLVISPMSERTRQAIGGGVITFGFQRWPSKPQVREKAGEQSKETARDAATDEGPESGE